MLPNLAWNHSKRVTIVYKELPGYYLTRFLDDFSSIAVAMPIVLNLATD